MAAAAVTEVRIRQGHRADVDAMLALEAVFPSDRMSRRSVRRCQEVVADRVSARAVRQRDGVRTRRDCASRARTASAASKSSGMSNTSHRW